MTLLPRLLLATLSLPALASAAGSNPSTTLGVEAAHESLDNGSDDWRALTLRARHDIAPRQLAEFTWNETERFGLRDNQLGLLYSSAIGAALTATVDANFSNTHRVLARNAAGASLQYEFRKGWLAHAGLRTSDYSSARVNQAQLAIEQYVGAASWSLAWRPTRAFGTTAHSAELRAAWYYGERNAIGVSYARGQEAASTPFDVTLTDVRAAALTGRHAIAPRWTVNYALSHTRNSGLYTRKGISGGLAYTF
jgi:YaiO family outer membrane protein